MHRLGALVNYQVTQLTQIFTLLSCSVSGYSARLQFLGTARVTRTGFLPLRVDAPCAWHDVQPPELVPNAQQDVHAAELPLARDVHPAELPKQLSVKPV